MSFTITLIVGLGVLLHLILGRLLGSPWLVPDLTLVSVVLTMARLPGHPISPSLVAGCLTLLTTARHPQIIGLAYVAAGWLIRWLSSRWDLEDVFLQLVAVGLAEAFLVLVWLFLGVQASPSLLILSGVKLSVTVITMACLLFATRRLVT